MLYQLDQKIDGDGGRFIVYDPPPTVRRTLELVDPDASLRLRHGGRWPSA